MNVIIATVKTIHVDQANQYAKSVNDESQIHIVSDPAALLHAVEAINPDIIFFPHWSWIIPETIFETIPCVVFHTADLPFGRGGSPIQNQIKRGIFDSYVCALQVTRGLDEGDLYMKYPVSLLGTADEILMRISQIIFQKMIPELIHSLPVPVAQQGVPTVFKRLAPACSKINDGATLEELFHNIQMLDGEDYPPAFIESEAYKIEFTRASLKPGYLLADAKIIRKGRI